MRRAKVRRKTNETDIAIELNIDGRGRYKIKTGIGFLDHMLSLLAKHGLFDLEVNVKRSDLEVDIHHTNEDVGIVLGEAFEKALGRKERIMRFGEAVVPMEEARAEAALDLSGRASLRFEGTSHSDEGAGYSARDAQHFLKAFVDNAGINLHIKTSTGDSHHVLEAAFKALALALRRACARDARVMGVPSTKGKLA